MVVPPPWRRGGALGLCKAAPGGWAEALGGHRRIGGGRSGGRSEVHGAMDVPPQDPEQGPGGPRQRLEHRLPYHPLGRTGAHPPSKSNLSPFDEDFLKWEHPTSVNRMKIGRTEGN